MAVKKAAIVFALGLLAACGNPPPSNSDPDPEGNGGFGNQPKPANNEPDNEGKGITVVVDVNDVGEFRGTKMARLLQKMDSIDPAEWALVRRHVFPRPLPPAVYDKAGKLTKRNYDWPPKDPRKPTDQQKAWRSYLLWPEFISDLLNAKDWNTPATRTRLANIGRMYELTWNFQRAKAYDSPTQESEHWRTYAESMLAYGVDGERMLVSNMILALTNPSEDAVRNAQSVLVQVGEPAVEMLCSALWVGFRQAAVLDDGSYTVQTNANFNKFVVDTLYRIGPRAASQAVYELENTLDDEKQAKGSAWRFRKHFVDLIGRFGLPDTLRTLESEIDRVKIIEYDPEELKRGREVVDEAATSDSTFVFREYLLQAFAGFRQADALRGVVRIWALDEEHADGAISAVLKITGKSVRSLEQTRALAKSLKVDLKEG